MDYRERIRYFYEVIVSNHLIDRVSEYISNDYTVRIGEKIILAGVVGVCDRMHTRRRMAGDEADRQKADIYRR